MELVIDHESLENIINDLVNDAIKKPYYTGTTVAIGEFNGIQLQVSFQRDVDDFLEMKDDANYHCVTVK